MGNCIYGATILPNQPSMIYVGCAGEEDDLGIDKDKKISDNLNDPSTPGFTLLNKKNKKSKGRIYEGRKKKTYQKDHQI